MPVKLSPEEAAKKWSERLSGSTSIIASQVAKVTTAPSSLAVKKKDKMKTKLIAAIDSGKWERNLGSVTLDEWKTQMATKGIPRISGGATAAQPKVTDFFRDLFPHIETGQAKVAAMPDLTLEDGINRAATMMRHMATFKR